MQPGERENWKDRFAAELELARDARQRGNEGRARVCARRAAGIVTAEYLRRSGSIPAGSAYDLLRRLQSLPGVSPQVQEIAAHFLTRVTPAHTLPLPADLVAEAEWLASELLGE